MTENSATLWIIVALAVAAIVVAAAIASRRRARLRSAELRQRFGPEYDKAVAELGSPARAERELAGRAHRVERLHFRELNDAERARFASSWSHIQAQFVDDPATAVGGASELIKDVMRARGYPIDDFDQRVADLSVDHPNVVQHYRAARALSDSSRNGRASTEDLRQAVVHYRALFADLLQETGPHPVSLRESHA
jgi:signal transduction histidine kinase